MFKQLFVKLKEALFSVLPVSLLVIIADIIGIVSFETEDLITFCVSSVFLMIGIALFNLGAEMSMTPMGEYVGNGLTKAGKPLTLLVTCFAMGLFITIAEPDLSVLADQVSSVIDPMKLIIYVGVGVGLFLVISMIRIFSNKELSPFLLFFYMTLFSLAALLLQDGKGRLLPLAFDSGGVTTGPVTVPFLMALGVGIAQAVGGKNATENSFGSIALCSVGPVLAVLILSLSSSGQTGYHIPDYSAETSPSVSTIFTLIGEVSLDVLRSLALISAFFMLIQFFILKLPKKALIRIGFGLLYTFVGLVIFLVSVTLGFMPLGLELGSQLASKGGLVLTIFAFILGMLTVLAEPAVHVLNHQVEAITGGAITRRQMIVALSIGVGVSIALSMIRILVGFSILYYLIPGYLISLGLSLLVPGLYTSIAFDSGGVASGPLTSSFILPIAIGACTSLNGSSSILSLAFGIVAMVAMTPLITIQTLGFKAIAQRFLHYRLARKRIISSDDAQIIYFE